MVKPGRVLVIDDSSETHEVVELLFGSAHVVHAWNGREGLDHLRTMPHLDVVILDLVMPVLDGFGVLQQIRADRRYQFLPVCVFTANKDDATKALSMGAQDFIDKRADYQELRLRVQNLVEAKRRAEAASHAKADFLAVVSHELRTPMNGILGMTEAIRDGALSPDQSQFLDILEQAARKMTGLIDNLLQFLESENPLHGLPQTPFGPRQLVLGVLNRLSDEAQKYAVQIEPRFGPGIPETVWGLPDKVGQVLHHLAGNAIKFSPGGRAVVALDAEELSADEVRLLFSVRDTGVGLPEGWKEAIFHPFTQVDSTETRPFGGMGIGLSIAGRMVQLLGGQLFVESEQGHGSLFRFELTVARGSVP